MKREDMELLLNYLKDKNDLNDEMKNCLDRIEICVKQIKVEDNFRKDMAKLTEDLEKLK